MRFVLNGSKVMLTLACFSTPIYSPCNPFKHIRVRGHNTENPMLAHLQFRVPICDYARQHCIVKRATVCL